MVNYRQQWRSSRRSRRSNSKRSIDRPLHPTSRRDRLRRRVRNLLQQSRLQNRTILRAQIPIASALARGFLHSAFFDAGPPCHVHDPARGRRPRTLKNSCLIARRLRTIKMRFVSGQSPRDCRAPTFKQPNVRRRCQSGGIPLHLVLDRPMLFQVILMDVAMPEPEKIIRIRTVLQRTGLSRSTVYRKMEDGTFPPKVKLSEHCCGWRESEVNHWITDPPSYRH